MTIVLELLVMAVSIAIIVRVEPALNRMSRCTSTPIRAAYVLMAVGAAAQLLAVLSGKVPTFDDLALLAGVAGLLVCDRRRCPSTVKENSNA